MKYRCNDEFMVRIPSLPKDIFEENDNTDKDIFEFFKNYPELSRFLEESLLISSKSLYNSLKCFPKSKKKIKNLELGLIKYIKRICTRATPYGLFAGVGLGKFSEKAGILINSNRYIKEAKVDTYWLLHLIHEIEQDQHLVSQLMVKWNTICYKYGDRMKNPYFSNHGDLDNSADCIEENSIRCTALVELVKEQTKNFVSYSKIKEIIYNKYGGIKEELLDRTLMQLIENEYLITDLRIPSYCDDALGYVISILKEKDGVEEIVKQLIEIQSLLRNYKKEINVPNLLEEIYDKMSKLFSTKNYVEVNKGLILEQNYLSNRIKEKLEHFVETLSALAIESNEYSELEKFKEEFSEKYGFNVEVPLTEIIDSNGFNGINFLGKINGDIGRRETIIKGIVDRKIVLALMNKEESVYLKESDFSELLSQHNEENLPKSFDMNFYITRNNKENEYNLIVGPNVGAKKAGMMFQRFYNVFNQDVMREYNKIYEKEIELSKDEYLLVEAREVSVKGRVGNVNNQFRNHEFYLNVACENKDTKGQILLSDLHIGLSFNRKLYIKSRTYNKKIKVIADNMLNPQLNSKVLYLLKRISDEYENSLINRIHCLYENVYNYTPRIYLDDVIVKLKRWKFSTKSLRCDKFEMFKTNFNCIRQNYNIDKYIYQCEDDNRLLLNLDKPKTLEILYSTIKKQGKLELSEIEPGLFLDTIVEDENNNKYISEYAFSFIQNNKLNTGKKSIFNNSIILQENERIFNLCQNGWIYIKLYGIGNRANEILTSNIQSLTEELNPEIFFFLRYSEGGNHLRIRFKFKNEKIALEKLTKINRWILEVSRKKLITRSVFDTYEREINRYGGNKLIPIAEKLFFMDSIFVIKLLKLFDTNNEEEIEILYIVGILSIFKDLTFDEKEMFEILDLYIGGDKSSFRKEFQDKRNYYLDIVQAILSDDLMSISPKFEQIITFYQQRKFTLLEFRSILEKQEKDNKITNTKSNIITSISHMYCNRIKGDLDYENKYRAIIRHCIYNLIRKWEHMELLEKEKLIF